MTTTLRSSMLWVHRWTGLTIGLIAVLLAVTGGLLVLRPELEPLVYPHAGTTCAQSLSMDSIAELAHRARPGIGIDNIQYGSDLRAPRIVRYADDDQLFFDSCSGRTIDRQHRWGGVFGASEWLHRAVVAHDWGGTIIIGTASLVLGLIGVIGGLYLWWPTRRSAWRSAVKFNPKLKGRAFALNLHTTVGLYTSIIVFIAAMTAVPISFGWAEKALYTVTGSSPAKNREAPKSQTKGSCNLELAWEEARGLLPKPPRMARLKCPAKQTEPIAIYMIAGDAPHGEARDYAYFDRTTGKLLAWYPYAGLPAGKKLYYSTLAIHEGELGGLPVQLLLLFGMIGVPVMGYTGIDSWLRRRRRKRGGRTSELTPMRIASTRDEASDVKVLKLVPDNGASLPTFTAGAHVDVRVGEFERQYSLINGPGDRDGYLIGVRLDPASRGGSAAIHRLKQGDRVLVGTPKNHFPLVDDAHHHMLFAAGIGITPLLSMARHLDPDGHSFELHYFARTDETAAFRPEIVQGELGKRARLRIGLGRNQIRLDVAEAVARREDGSHLYTCGPLSFMDMVVEEAERAGWPADCIHRENFAADPDALAGPMDEIEVTLARSGAEYFIAPDKSILEALIEHGVDVEGSCEQGTCGTCLTKVLTGEIDHRDSFLSQAEKQCGDKMLICVSRAKGRSLILDL
jgi:ferredoxin-NADP reductase